jgi:hypothetical protein
MYYTLKTTTTYRVPTVEDALALRKHLEKTCHGELTAFKYTTKYIKAKGEIIEEYQVVTATISIDNEKDPEGVLTVDFNEEF